MPHCHSNIISNERVTRVPFTKFVHSRERPGCHYSSTYTCNNVSMSVRLSAVYCLSWLASLIATPIESRFPQTRRQERLADNPSTHSNADRGGARQALCVEGRGCSVVRCGVSPSNSSIVLLLLFAVVDSILDLESMSFFDFKI